MIKKIVLYVILPLCLLISAVGIYAAFFVKPAEKEANTSENESSVEANIKVSSPILEEEVGLPIVLSGEARVFENQFNYELRDGAGNILGSGSLYANSPDVGQFGSFSKEIYFEEPKTEAGVLEVFDYSAKDGSKADVVSVPVKFKKVESTSVNLYFGNSVLDPEVLDCKKVFSVKRRIPITQTPARLALILLLEGPTAQEFKDGYYTSINQGVKIQKLTIENGVAKADFDETLEAGVGGSCKVAFIRSQLVNALKQFSSVKEVVISIDGRTEDILQP